MQNFSQAISIASDKIHYQQFDSIGRLVRVLVDNDAKESTGTSQAGNDGEQVNGIDQVIAYKHNVKGKVTEMQRDNNVDGVYDYRETYTLDANGHRIEKFTDLTNDGQFNKKEVYTREADGGLVQTDFYNLVAEGDSTRDVLTKIEYYELNENNQRTKLSLNDGSIDSITSYELDALDRVAKSYFDTNGDNVIDSIETYSRNTSGYMLRNEIANAEGEVQTIRTYVRDANNYMIESIVDNGADSVVDLHYIYTRDVYGNELTNNRYSYNSITGELELTNTIERVFNELNQVEVAKYSGLSENYTIEYTYDDYGRDVSRLYTGDINRRWDYIYNDDDTIKERLQYDLDGVYQGKTVNVEFSPEFKLAILLEAYDSKDELIDITKYLRSENGNILNTLRDLASNGIGSWDYFNFGDRGRGTSFNTSIALTNWSEEQLAELGSSITRIGMGNGAVSQLTLNAEVVAKISEGGLRVLGAEDKNDVLNLSGFIKADSSDVRNYDLYTASFDGEDLKLYVQANDSITTNIIG